ncbi:hypothetical protein ACFWYW_48440 [Nonomuraea sp. NPDC059023]|uniref:hypothetical protein n=1 Tax=unclassified Nonomuraea TaxID=2593643 RepID=UPI0036881143
MAWWQSGWGVWRGEEPDLTAPPAYRTDNITQAASDAAAHWALGVVPDHSSVHIRDPDGAARFVAGMEERRSRRWWQRLSS